MLKHVDLSNSRFGKAKKADAIRLDWYGTANTAAASAFMDRLLEMLRFLSFQWWITRDRRFDEGYLKNSFAINELGERLEGVMALAQM